MERSQELHDSHVSFPRYMAALVCSSIFATGMALLLPLVSLRLAADGHTPVEIGIVGVCLAVGGILSPWLVPRMVASFGLIRIAAFGLAGMAASVLLFMLTEGSILLWYLLSLAYSVGLALAFIVSETVLITSSSRARRPLALGFYGAAYAVGYALGPALLAGIGFEGVGPYMIALALPLVAMAVVLRMPPIRREGQWGGIESAGLLEVLPRMRFGVVCAFAVGATEVTAFNLLPVYAKEVGHTETQAALLLTMVGVGNVVFAPAIGWFAWRWGFAPTVAVASAILLAGTPALYWVVGGGPSGTAAPAMMLWGAGVEAVYLLGMFIVAMGFSGPRLVAAGALFALSFSLGMLAGPLLGGILMEHVWPPHGLLALWMALAVLLPVSFLAFRRDGPCPEGAR